MRRTRVGRWLWVPALACGVAGAYWLADLGGTERGETLALVAPHALGVALVAWTGRGGAAAGLAALAGSVAMAGLSWGNASGRVTEGSDWEFDHAVLGTACQVLTWIVLGAAATVAPLMMAESAGPPAGG